MAVSPPRHRTARRGLRPLAETSGSWLRSAAVLALAALAGPSASADGGDRTFAEVEADARRALEAPVLGRGGDVDLRGATVWTATGETFAPGRVVVEGGRIAFVGPDGDGPDCASCAVVDASGRWITPGLIDTHSHLGVYPSPGFKAHSDGNEMTAPTTPGVWAESGAWPQDPGFQRAVAGGITTLMLLPGSANLIGGRGVVLRPLPARGARAMRFPGAPETLKMACGENPKRVYGDKGGPGTRMGNVRGYREAFFAARRYLDAWEAHDAAVAAEREGRRRRKDPPIPAPPDRDADLDTLAGLLRGDVLAHVHCYRADDMLSFLQVADEAGFSVRSFHHALEAYKIRDLLAEHEVSVSTWADWWGFKAEAYDGIPANAAFVAAAGGRAIIHSDSAIGIQRLNQEASKAWHAGRRAGLELPRDEALRWITLHPAWALGIDDEVGSLEVGKRGDLVVWSEDPLSVYAEATNVWIDGVDVYDAANPGTWSDFVRGQEVP